MKHKTPAMTLREAFEMRRLRERANNGCDDEDNSTEDSPPPAAPSVTTVPLAPAPLRQDAGKVTMKPAAAVSPPLPAELEDEQEPDWEDAVEEVEEEPVDPAKVAAELAAAREKKRLAEAESKRMKARHREKEELPKYQEMLARRSTLPAFQMKDAILSAIDQNSVVVISGDTGDFL